MRLESATAVLRLPTFAETPFRRQREPSGLDRELARRPPRWRPEPPRARRAHPEGEPARTTALASPASDRPAMTPDGEGFPTERIRPRVTLAPSLPRRSRSFAASRISMTRSSTRGRAARRHGGGSGSVCTARATPRAARRWSAPGSPSIVWVICWSVASGGGSTGWSSVRTTWPSSRTRVVKGTSKRLAALRQHGVEHRHAHHEAGAGAAKGLDDGGGLRGAQIEVDQHAGEPAAEDGFQHADERVFLRNDRWRRCARAGA